MPKYESITKFIEPFSTQDTGKWVVDLDHTGTHEDPIPMPWVDYERHVHDFIMAFDEFTDYRYQETLKRNGIEWGTKSMESFDVSSANEECLLALITGAIRADRFCEGALLDFVSNGCIPRWLERLKELDA